MIFYHQEVFEETTQQQYSSNTNTPKKENSCEISPLRNSCDLDKQQPTVLGGGGTVFPQRRARFHAKGRAPSCSSSDASDDDSEGRKKRRAHRIAASGNGKPLPGRRDSYDDSSDSQVNILPFIQKKFEIFDVINIIFLSCNNFFFDILELFLFYRIPVVLAGTIIAMDKPL